MATAYLLSVLSLFAIVTFVSKATKKDKGRWSETLRPFQVQVQISNFKTPFT